MSHEAITSFSCCSPENTKSLTLSLEATGESVPPSDHSLGSVCPIHTVASKVRAAPPRTTTPYKGKGKGGKGGNNSTSAGAGGQINALATQGAATSGAHLCGAAHKADGMLSYAEQVLKESKKANKQLYKLRARRPTWNQAKAKKLAAAN